MRVLAGRSCQPPRNPGSAKETKGGGQTEIAIPKENKKIITATIFLARDYACYMANTHPKRKSAGDTLEQPIPLY